MPILETHFKHSNYLDECIAVLMPKLNLGERLRRLF